MSSRYPDYHRLDILWLTRWHLSGWNIVLYLSVQNLYGRKNIAGYQYNDDGTRDNVYQWGFFPIGGLQVEFKNELGAAPAAWIKGEMVAVPRYAERNWNDQKTLRVIAARLLGNQWVSNEFTNDVNGCRVERALASSYRATSYRGNIVSRQHRIEANRIEATSYRGNIVSRQHRIEATSYRGNIVSRQHRIEATSYRGNIVSRQHRIEATSYRGNIVSRQHRIEATSYRGNIVSRQHRIEATSYRGNIVSRQHRIEATSYRGNIVSRQHAFMRTQSQFFSYFYAVIMNCQEALQCYDVSMSDTAWTGSRQAAARASFSNLPRTNGNLNKSPSFGETFHENVGKRSEKHESSAPLCTLAIVPGRIAPPPTSGGATRRRKSNDIKIYLFRTGKLILKLHAAFLFPSARPLFRHVLSVHSSLWIVYDFLCLHF